MATFLRRSASPTPHNARACRHVQRSGHWYLVSRQPRYVPIKPRGDHTGNTVQQCGKGVFRACSLFSEGMPPESRTVGWNPSLRQVFLGHTKRQVGSMSLKHDCCCCPACCITNCSVIAVPCTGAHPTTDPDWRQCRWERTRYVFLLGNCRCHCTASIQAAGDGSQADM